MSLLNLLPDDYLLQRGRRRENVLCLGLFAVVMIAVVGAILASGASSRQTCLVRDRVNAQYADAAKLIDQMQQLQAQKAALLAKAEQASALLERVPRSYVLGVIANACPENTSLVQVRLDTRHIEAADVERLAASKFDLAQQKRLGIASSTLVEIEVTGQASTDVEVARLIANLAQNPLLTGVDLVYSEQKMVDQVAVREFQVKMALKPNMDVMDLNGQRPLCGPRPAGGPSAGENGGPNAPAAAVLPPANHGGAL